MFNKIALSAALASCIGFAHADPNLVTDGSFEDQSQASGSWSIYNTLPGWTTVSGPGIEVRNNVAGAAYDGNNFVELDSSANSAMAQTLTTLAGTPYTLSFAYSGRSGVGADSNPVEVLWDGSLVASVTANGSAQSGNVWGIYSYTVLGTGRDTLTFRAAGLSDSVGGSLDAVSVSAAVPEPSTWALMLGGIALIGMSLARRRKAI